MQATPNEIPRWIADRTVIYLMPMGCMQLLVNGMIKLGYPGDVHVALVEKTGWGADNGERVTKCCLDLILGEVVERDCRGPAVLVVGWGSEATRGGASSISSYVGE
jgi:siroheme synthase